MARTGVSRRGFLQAATLAGAATMGWMPSIRIGRVSSRATTPPPPQFPDGIALYQQAYENWSGEIRIPDVWTAAPRSGRKVAILARPVVWLTRVIWARASGVTPGAEGMATST